MISERLPDFFFAVIARRNLGLPHSNVGNSSWRRYRTQLDQVSHLLFFLWIGAWQWQHLRQPWWLITLHAPQPIQVRCQKWAIIDALFICIWWCLAFPIRNHVANCLQPFLQVLKPYLLLDCAQRWILIAHAQVLPSFATCVNLIMHEASFEADCFAFCQNMLSTATVDANEATIGHVWLVFRMIPTISFVEMGKDLFATLANRIYLSTKYFDKKLGQTVFLSRVRHSLCEGVPKLLYEDLHVEIDFSISLMALYHRLIFVFRVEVIWCHLALKILGAVDSLRLRSWILSRMLDALRLGCIDDDSGVAHLKDLVREYLVTIFASLKCLDAFGLLRFGFARHQIYLLQRQVYKRRNHPLNIINYLLFILQPFSIVLHTLFVFFFRFCWSISIKLRFIYFQFLHQLHFCFKQLHQRLRININHEHNFIVNIILNLIVRHRFWAIR